MSATIHRLPIASPSYFTVRRLCIAWSVQLVTPNAGKDLRTTLLSFPDRDEAIAYGAETAANLHRPFRIGGTA